MKQKIFFLFLFALVLRILLIPIAHHGDLNNNISWGNLAIERGLNNFYEGRQWPYSAPNQPPLYILLFTSTSLIYKLVHDLFWSLNNSVPFFPSPLVWFWQERGVDIMAKLPGIIADLGIGFAIFKYFSKERKKAFVLTSIWLFNPVTIYSSSVWGQTDSIVNFWGILSIIYLLKKRLVQSILFLVISLLFKPSLTIFIPLLFFIALFQKYNTETWMKAIAYCLVPIALVSLPFHLQPDLPIWLFNLYTNRFFPGEIGYLTANAFNFWWLVDAGRTLDSTLYYGLSAKILGYILVSINLIGLILLLKRNISAKNILMSLSLISLITFLFLTRIHERYLYPFFPAATILLGFIPALIVPYILISAVHLLNLYHLFWIPNFSPLESMYSNPLFPQVLSIITIMIFIFYSLKFSRSKN